MTFNVRQVCIVTAGADEGKEVVIKAKIDDNFVTISGEKVKERRCNVMHLQPTGRTVTVIPTKAEKPKKAEASNKPVAEKKAPAKKAETKKKA